MSADEPKATGASASSQPPRCPENMHIPYRVVNQPGLDVFGQSVTEIKKGVEISCTNCGQALASSRYARHLEKCMVNLKLGRQSNRVANQRLRANDHEDSTYLQDEDDFEEADLEAAFSSSAEQRGKKRHRPNGQSPRPQKIKKLLNIDDQPLDTGHQSLATGSATSSTASSPQSAPSSSTGSSVSSDWMSGEAASGTNGASPAHFSPADLQASGDDGRSEFAALEDGNSAHTVNAQCDLDADADAEQCQDGDTASGKDASSGVEAGSLRKGKRRGRLR